jgi:hypothetical protein
MFSVRAGAARIDPLRGTLSVVPLAPVDQPDVLIRRTQRCLQSDPCTRAAQQIRR